MFSLANISIYPNAHFLSDFVIDLKILPTINTNNEFCYDCCDILKKPRNKSFNKNDLRTLEAVKAERHALSVKSMKW